jgi:uncharacterized membrane protein
VSFRTLSFITTLLRAAVFGLITCATYDLTDLAIVKDWAGLITIVDMAWGTGLSEAGSFISFMKGKWLS